MGERRKDAARRLQQAWPCHNELDAMGATASYRFLRLGHYHSSDDLLPVIVAFLCRSPSRSFTSLILTLHPQKSHAMAQRCSGKSSITKLPSPPHVSNCHFCSPPLCASFTGALLLAIFTSAVFMYSCARLAQTFLCVLVSAFLQSREQ